jgi:hypothetical protein
LCGGGLQRIERSLLVASSTGHCDEEKNGRRDPGR